MCMDVLLEVSSQGMLHILAYIVRVLPRLWCLLIFNRVTGEFDISLSRMEHVQWNMFNTFIDIVFLNGYRGCGGYRKN